MEIKNPKILVVRKMSPLEYHYKFQSNDPLLKAGHEGNNTSIEKIKELLTIFGKNFDVVTRDELSEDFVSNYDFVFSAGGDGTAIATASYNKDRPQLNIKSEEHSAGALCQHNLEEAVEKTITGDYHIVEWSRLDVYLGGKFIGRASNEVYVASAGIKPYPGARNILKYTYKGKLTEESKMHSGMVVATGTGSTGWQGTFTPFPRDSKEFAFRIGFPPSEEVRADHLQITSIGHKGGFSLDCAEKLEYNFPRDSQLEIKISEYPLKVVVPNI